MSASPSRIFYWINHTGRYDGNTGVQRVVRGLGAGFASQPTRLVPVTWCPERETLLHADAEVMAGIARFHGPNFDVARGEEGTPLHLSATPPRPGEWLLLPEVPHVVSGGAPVLPVVFDYARFYGLRPAVVFYDLIPLRQPGYEAMADAHANYSRALHLADLVLPISRFAGQDLSAWWVEQGFTPESRPPLVAVPLPEEQPGVPRGAAGPEPKSGPVRFLAVGSVEPRKNQLELIRAFRRLKRRRPDLDIALDIVGSLHSAVAPAVAEEARAEPTVRLHGFLPDEQVMALMRASHATAFVSLAEGYGLPIAESLWLGRPCIASDIGCMREITKGGGCLAVDPTDPAAIEAALEQLASDSALRRRLTAEAAARPLRRWADYAAAIGAALAATPPLSRLVVLEGSAASADAQATACAAAGIRTDLLHWRAETRAILPGPRAAPRQPLPGEGLLSGRWAVLPLATTRDDAEAVDLCAEARGLGLKVAVLSDRDPAPALLTATDLLFCADAAARDRLVALAMHDLPKTTLLRGRARIAATLPEAVAQMAVARPLTAPPPVPRRPARVFYWVHLTVQQPFNTGVQRVTRLLGAALERAGVELVPVKWDAQTGRVALLSTVEATHLARWGGPPTHRVAPLPERFDGEWLILPEISVPETPPGLGIAALARKLGFRLASIFYDIIPVKLRDSFPKDGLDAWVPYWHGFSQADVALPISWSVAADLRRYLTEHGLPVPAIIPCPLGGELPETSRSTVPLAEPAADAPLRLLAIGTWEPRKNYPRLLRALAQLSRDSARRPINLTVVGRRAAEYPALAAEIERLAVEAGSVTLGTHVSDEELRHALLASDATVFASWEEGFGLPVLESLWHGLPCLCHDGSAMAEVAPGGGVLAVDMLDEAAIAAALRRLAEEPGLLTRLSAEAVARPIRDWDGYAADVLAALSHSHGPGWPLPAIITRRAPLLSLALTTYNRASWLAHSLPRLIEAARPWRDVVEVVVCDNTSTDNTPTIVARHEHEPYVTARRNPTNVGMLGNLGVTARACRGAFVWLLGDDDLLIDGALENVLEGLVRHPDVEMAYANYAYTSFDAPEQIADAAAVIRRATPIVDGGPNRRVPALREVAALNENLFTAIYCCIFRRDHALRAYQLDTRGSPFSSLATCVPSSVYTLNALMDRPAWWVGEPAVVVNMNVSWLRWVLLWHLERMPDLYDLAEAAGARPEHLDRYRRIHSANAAEHVRMALFDASDEIRAGVSVERLIERCKHLPEFRNNQVGPLFEIYARAWAAGRVIADGRPPEELFAAFGLTLDTKFKPAP
jgi:glycosyltransferase involved in cell wall biosynthesis